MSKLAFLNKQKGFSLVETVIYAALLVVVTVLVVSGLMQLSTAYAKVKNERKINEAATIALDRAVREFRRATSTPAYLISSSGNFDSATTTVFGTFAEQVRRDGAVSHWDFEEGSGQLLDRIGTNNGTLKMFLSDNSERRQVALVGNGYVFDGVDTYITLGNNVASLNALQSGAVEAIMSSAAGSEGFRTIFSASRNFSPWSEDPDADANNDLNSAQVFIKFQNGSSDKVTLGKAKSGGVGGAKLKIGETLLQDGEFFHIASQIESNSTESYVGGSKESYSLDDISPALEPLWFKELAELDFFGVWPTYYWIGRVGDVSTKFSGIIDELAIYPAPLSSGRLKAHHEAAFGITPSVNTDHEVTKSLQVENGALVLKMMLADGSNTTAYRQKLTSDGVTVTAFNVTGVGPMVGAVKTKYKGIRIELTLQSGVGKTLSTETFYATVTPRVTE